MRCASKDNGSSDIAVAIVWGGLCFYTVCSFLHMPQVRGLGSVIDSMLMQLHGASCHRAKGLADTTTFGTVVDKRLVPGIWKIGYVMLK